MFTYLFAAIRRTDLTNHIQKIRINADSELQARAVLAREFVLVLAGKISLKHDRTFSPEQNHSLPNAVDVGSICGTTTVTGHRTRKTCGFFVSQIPFKGLLYPENIEFAVRLISRDKAEYIRTNKASRVTAVVETVSHLLAIYPFNHLLKTVTAMKNPIQKLTVLLVILPTPVLSLTQGAQMFNQSILSVLQSCTSFNKLNKYSEINPMSEEDLKALRNESENLCESIEYGLFAIGKMMEHLGCLTDEREQNFSHNALDNATVRHLGGLIQANAYLLNALRDSAGNAEFHLSNMKGGVNE